mmetsp:Transcript_32877/g.72606  ORF Transcript_32877/g.72606 Transcript_32877/m.72606 type:complete len:409 (+) Transcript_32877:42-1268(+)
MTGGGEPAGLFMSLDSLIEKRGKNDRDSGRGQGRGRGQGEGRGSPLGARGGISKKFPGRGQQGNFGDNRRDQGPAPGRGVGSGDRGRGAMRGGGRFGGRFGGRGDMGGRGGQFQGPPPGMMMQQPGFNPAAAGMSAAGLMQLQVMQHQLMVTQHQLAQLQAQQRMLAAATSTGATNPTVPAANPRFPGQPNHLAQGAAAAVPAALPAEMEEVDEPEVDCECFVDEDSGNVVVQLEGTTIVSVTPTGEVTLSTSGWWTADTISGMNQALRVIGMKVIASGDPEDGNWRVSDGSKLIRFQDDMKIPSKGVYTSHRANAILQAFHNPKTRQLAATANVASSAAALGMYKQPSAGGQQAAGYGGGMGADGMGKQSLGVSMTGRMGSGGLGSGAAGGGSADVIRRLKAQGRLH